MAKGEEESVLRFSCDSCGTHLGVDESLAGTQAPCPKCGTLLTAPVPLSGAPSGEVESRGDTSLEEPFASSESSSEWRRGRRRSSGRFSEEGVIDGEERENLRALVKILIATALVAVLVGLIVWYLKNY